MKFSKKFFMYFLVFSLLWGCSTKKSEEKSLTSNQITESNYFQELYLPIKNSNDKWGYISTSGKIVIEPTLDASNAYPFDPYNNEFAIIKSNSDNENNWYVIDKNGKIIYDERNSIVDYTLMSSYFDQDGNIIIQDKDNLWKLNANGEKTKTKYFPYYVFKSIAINPDLSCCQEQGNYLKYYCMNSLDEILFISEDPFMFPYNEMYEETIGLACLHENNEDQTETSTHYYYINEQGNRMFDDNFFDSATFFTKKGYAVITKDGQSSIIKKSGEVIYTLKENEKYITSQDGNIFILFGESQKYGLKDLSGNIILNEKYITIDTIFDKDNNINFFVTMFENENYVTYIIDKDENIVTSYKELTLTKDTISDIFELTNGKTDLTQLNEHFNSTMILGNRIILANQCILDQNGLLLNIEEYDAYIQNYFYY